MENWTTQLIGLVTAFLVGVLTNLATPSIRTFFHKSSLSLRNARIKAIKDEYKAVKEYRENLANFSKSQIAVTEKSE